MARAKKGKPKQDAARQLILKTLRGTDGVPVKDLEALASKQAISKATLHLVAEHIVSGFKKAAPGSPRAVSQWTLAKPACDPKSDSPEGSYEDGFKRGLAQAKRTALVASGFEDGFRQGLAEAKHAAFAAVGEHAKLGKLKHADKERLKAAIEANVNAIRDGFVTD